MSHLCSLTMDTARCRAFVILAAMATGVLSWRITRDSAKDDMEARMRDQRTGFVYLQRVDAGGGVKEEPSQFYVGDFWVSSSIPSCSLLALPLTMCSTAIQTRALETSKDGYLGPFYWHLFTKLVEHFTFLYYSTVLELDHCTLIVPLL